MRIIMENNFENSDTEKGRGFVLGYMTYDEPGIKQF